MSYEKAGLNPYLPSGEYIPDGEPHVFGDRIYVYGSHDQANGTEFCQKDYVVWSAPVDDLSDWSNRGISYRKKQDPFNQGKYTNNMWAPDACRGADGRYYLYYCLEFVPQISIAVSDNPDGPFEFYDYVRYKDGSIYNKNLPFDPGILYEDREHIYLYTGFGCQKLPDDFSVEVLKEMPQFQEMSEEALQKMFRQIQLLKNPSQYASCLQLSDDMKTIIKENDQLIPSLYTAKQTSFEEHPFFEASSIRKIKERYYFVYSSLQGHELCYATSRYPDKDFSFGGVIISNMDIGFEGNDQPLAYGGNNHGGLVQIKGEWYIFYHRHTHANQFSRQGCAEKINICQDGSIPQVEMTSYGLYGKPLPATNKYSTRIACHLMGPRGASFINQDGMPKDTPYITEEKDENQKINNFVTNLNSGAVFGIKYLSFNGETHLRLRAKGKGKINFILHNFNDKAITSIDIDSENWKDYTATFSPISGIAAIYFRTDQISKPISVLDFYFEKLEDNPL